ncbi:MAG: hypothetical protein IMF19_15140, partial [Proteobacteria bacterium]|nr:hypothetical protein [Pseudomonadota bacterium]
KSFVIRDGAVVYYTKSTYNQNTEIENYHVEVKNGRHEYFDEHIGELNPLYHLIYLSQSGWRKEAYKDALKVCIKEGFLTDWNGIDKLNFNEMELLSVELEKESEFNISNAKVLQKWLNRAVNDLARSHIELFRDLCMIAISSDSES